MLSHTLGEGDTLYVIVDGNKCKKNNHLLFPTSITIKLTNGGAITLDGQYCWMCNEVQITRELCAQNSRFHDLILPKLFLKGLDDIEEDITNDFVPRARSIESKLAKYGYSVAQNSGLTRVERRKLLRRLISSKEVSKGYVVSLFQHLIATNGKKKGNELAVEKWKDDLDFVLRL